ncbi:penicillin-binding protein [Desulfosporosinus sp. SYSU MS00001]|uniref:penicillin-binding protein n=1 Tax=Desulfosporosinus sp. SYSU MS00001 TaxID=3416284 RepID=UPI003CE7DE45
MKGKKNVRHYFSRDYWVYAGIFLLIVLVVGRLLVLQVIQASDLQAKGIERRTADKRLQPKRGSIYDAQGNVLAQSVPVKEIYADPNTLRNLIAQKKFSNTKEQVAQELAEILDLNAENILDKLNKKLSWVSLAHQVDLQKANQVMALKIPGVGMNEEEKRVYPMGSLAASALGIVNLGGHGAEGIESYYDKVLFGMPGFQSLEQDTRARSIIETIDQNNPSRPGNCLVLTLDSTIQYLIEQQLDHLQQSTKADRVTILAMDPMSGRILGLGSRPTFDPTNYLTSSPEERRNLAISMSYEPGSTFKIITGCSALEEGVISTDETFPDPGYLRVGPRLITNWDSDQKPHGNPTLTEGMQLSSNVVLAQVGLKLSKSTFYTYLKAFGFGSKTGIDVSGEERGLLVPRENVRDLELATMSFGQANLVTPIQLLTAISAVANGGTLYRPYIVDAVKTPEGEVIQQQKPIPIRQVVSRTTATQMTNILEQVVTAGTGHLAQIPGIRVAGKTGTAQKVDPSTGGYSATDFIASFVAFAPAENPKIAVLVIIDTPKGEEGHQGGTLGGPPAKAIIEGVLQYYGIPAAQNTPSIIPFTADDSPIRPLPKPIIPKRSPGNGEVIIPDLTGMTIREAGDELAKSGLHFNFTGSGLVIQQNPQAGNIVNKGTIIEIKFSPLKP